MCGFDGRQEGPSGDPYANPGVNIRALSRLFECIRERQADYRYQICVSVLEIYNENIHDLLVDPDMDKTRKYATLRTLITVLLRS